MTGELAGVPSVSVMTERFVSAAELMSEVLGAPGYPFVVIEHPISSATIDELRRRAAVAADEIVVALTH